MDADAALALLAAKAGILPTYRDLAGIEKPTSQDTKRSLLTACGWNVENSAAVNDALQWEKNELRKRNFPEEMILVAGMPHRLQTQKSGSWQIILEHSDTVFAAGRSADTFDLPALPAGVHEFQFEWNKNSQTSKLICAPEKAPNIEDIAKTDRLWGVNLALYGLHSERNSSIGDYTDLAEASVALAANGADFCGINPVHAMGWSNDDAISPYSPSHRGYLNTRHIAVDQIRPRSEETDRLLAERKTTAKPQLDRAVEYALHDKYHRRILESLFSDFQSLANKDQNAGFDLFQSQEGADLARFSHFECLSELRGTNPQEWQDAAEPPVKSSRTIGERFHAWLQWHAQSQLTSAQQRSQESGMNLGLYLDLAVGARRDGAEAWMERDSIAEGVSIGAPPDHLSPAGQKWNLSAYAPKKLSNTGYRAFRQILSRNMRHCGVLRIDHILGLNRSFWIPDSGAPGGYVKQKFDTLLALIRIEATRNNTIVIGEDLGLVPNQFRKRLQESGLYSYSVLQYEKTPSGAFRSPSRLRKNSLACFGTHDTPTLAGFAEGRDIDWWEKLGWIKPNEGKEARTARQKECAALKRLGKKTSQKTLSHKKLTPLSHCVHTALAASPIAMVSVQLDDIEHEIEAQNLPGTINEHPNWQRKYKTNVDDLQQHAALREIGKLMMKNARGNRTYGSKEAVDEG